LPDKVSKKKKENDPQERGSFQDRRHSGSLISQKEAERTDNDYKILAKIYEFLIGGENPFTESPFTEKKNKKENGNRRKGKEEEKKGTQNPQKPQKNKPWRCDNNQVSG
jgi:hypothetical protein